MPSILQGNSRTVTILAGRTLRVRTTGQASVFFELGLNGTNHSVGATGFEFHNPDDPLRVTISAEVGTAIYTVFYSDLVPFTGNFTLAVDDDGKIFRCDDPSDVTVTVPGTLPECFSAAFSTSDAGKVTIAAGSGAAKRSSASALNSQYQWGSVLVAKNADDNSAEFVLGGDFA